MKKSKLDKLTVTQLWEMAGFEIDEYNRPGDEEDGFDPSYPCDSFAEFACLNKTIKELTDPHDPENADKKECEKFNLTPEQWSANIELAFRAKRWNLSSFYTMLGSFYDYHGIELSSNYTGLEVVEIYHEFWSYKDVSYWGAHIVNNAGLGIEDLTWVISPIAKAKKFGDTAINLTNDVDGEDVDFNDIWHLFEHLRKNDLLCELSG